MYGLWQPIVAAIEESIVFLPRLDSDYLFVNACMTCMCAHLYAYQDIERESLCRHTLLALSVGSCMRFSHNRGVALKDRASHIAGLEWSSLK